MSALVPTLSAFLKRFIISFLMLFDKAFETDISSDFKSQMITLEKQQETTAMCRT